MLILNNLILLIILLDSPSSTTKTTFKNYTGWLTDWQMLETGSHNPPASAFPQLGKCSLHNPAHRSIFQKQNSISYKAGLVILNPKTLDQKNIICCYITVLNNLNFS